MLENDACFVDAVQVLTGCTFGKGNLIFKDHGKMVLTVFSRSTGDGVRVAIRPDALKSKKRPSTPADNPEDRQSQMMAKILETPADQLFKIEQSHTELPDKARIQTSELYDICGEAVMKTKLEMRDNKKICRDCLDKI